MITEYVKIISVHEILSSVYLASDKSQKFVLFSFRKLKNSKQFLLTKCPSCGQFQQHFTQEFFCTKVLCTAFLQLHFGFVIFWCKNIGAKVAYKILIKLTPGPFSRYLASGQSTVLFIQVQFKILFVNKKKNNFFQSNTF